MSLVAPSVIFGRAAIKAFNTSKTTETALSTMISMLSMMAFPMEITTVLIKSRIVGTYFMTTFKALGRTSAITSPILFKSPLAS